LYPGRAIYISAPASATIVHMVEELDQLDAKMRELSVHVRQLREENQHLRRQLAESQSELATLNERVVAATRRLDTLIDELPGELRGNGR
jgi:chromosome segregation ATPase